jgi:Zn-finger nucleic acid-binding protein
MPLLVSPIDGSPMKQISRYGIELDVCPTTGGIWLDKGELEKLMAIIREAAEEDQMAQRPAQPQPQQVYQQPPQQYMPRPRYDDDDDDRYKKSHYKDDKYYGHGYKKKSKLSKVMDIFDF